MATRLDTPGASICRGESWRRPVGGGLHLSVWPHEVQTLLKELKPEGPMLSTRVSAEAGARDLLEKLAKWT